MGSDDSASPALAADARSNIPHNGNCGAARLDGERASAFARLALGYVTREFPNKLDHVLRDANDVRGPRALHPIFYGSFDWHSCVHGYWLLSTLLRRYPELPEAPHIGALLDDQLTPDRVAGELAYVNDAGRAGFERPYGWAWLLMLAAELSRHEGDAAQRRAAAIVPLARAFARRFVSWLPKATYPVRAGTHTNSAFALALAHEYATGAGDAVLRDAIAERARTWFLRDADAQAWEPSGEDFLSPVLVEAACMLRVLGSDAFAAWLARFLPLLERGEPRALFEPARVSDRSDGRIAHLDGLNLSRAWCFRSLARATSSTALRERLGDAVRMHLDASLPHVADDYMGAHWLATFALLALTA